MRWNIVCRIGESDTYLPTVDKQEDRCLVLHFSGGSRNERVRESVVAWIEERYKATLSGSVQDFVYAAMSAYIVSARKPGFAGNFRREFWLMPRLNI